MYDVRVKCPKCDSNNTLVLGIDKVHITQDKDKPNTNKVVATKDNIIYSCMCGDCANDFYCMIVLECIPKAISVQKEFSDIFTVTEDELKEYN